MAETTRRVLATGATGNTGKAIVTALAGHDVQVRAMVRKAEDAATLGVANAAVADFDDTAAVRAALTDVDRAYLVTPSSERAEAQQVSFVQAAADAGVGRIVLLSQLAAAEDSPVRFLRYHAVVERRIRELGLDYTFLRPNLFFQGLFALAPSIKASDSFAAPIGTAAISAVDVRDIADVAVAALTEDAHERATYTLTGPRALTHEQMAAALSSATRRTITFSDAPPAAFAAALDGIMPPWQIDGLLEDYAHYRRGEAAAVSTAVRDVTGHAPRTFEQFADEHSAVFSGAYAA